MSEYTPTEHEVRLVWSEWSSYGGLTDRPDYDATRTEMRAEFHRFLARVRRDAARETLDGLAAELMEAARDCALGGDHRGAVAWRNASAHTHHRRDTHYPEGDDQ